MMLWYRRMQPSNWLGFRRPPLWFFFLYADLMIPPQVFPGVTSPVHPHLYAQNAVEEEGDGETRGEEDVAQLCRSSEEPGETSNDLGDNGEGGKLASGLGTEVLANLRQL